VNEIEKSEEKDLTQRAQRRSTEITEKSASKSTGRNGCATGCAGSGEEVLGEARKFTTV
jgi:hypothetical protein